MEKRQRLAWVMMQGYRTSTLPPTVMWYASGREFKGRTDNYTLDLYRGKGFVLDKKFLDPILWDALEYEQYQTTPKAEQPQRGVSPLAREVINVMGRMDVWEGTASDLLGLLDTRGKGIPNDPIHLSARVVDPTTSDVLAAHGIAVERRRSNGKRLLCLRNFTQ